MDNYFKTIVERRDRPGHRQWRVSIDDYWTERKFYGRTRDKAVAKAQRWIDRQNRNTYRMEG